MNRRQFLIGVASVPIALREALVPFGSGTRGALAQGELPRVVTTIGQIADIARVVGAGLVTVEALMGPGVDPHFYKASEGDVIDLLDADIVLYNGLNLEGRMAVVLEKLAAEKTVVAVGEAIPKDMLLAPPEFAGQYDPHTWFDPTMWAYVVSATASAIAAEDPANAATYHANAERYLAELDALDQANLAKVATIPAASRLLVTAHDAFNYFGRHYDVEVVGLQGISTESEAGVSDIQRMADLIAERQVPAMFIESSVSPRTIEALQEAVRDRGHEVAIGGQLFSDAMGDEGTPEGTYLGMLEYNVNTITAALGGSLDPGA